MEMKNTSRAQMEMSTLAKLVIILVVMAVVILFFTGGFKQIGTQKFVAAANNSTSGTAGIDSLTGTGTGSIGTWF